MADDGKRRGGGLLVALEQLSDKGADGQVKAVAKALKQNYEETRSNAKYWSAIYWGFTFFAAALSALAGLVLKLESFLKNESLKKDIAAAAAVSGALLITISTSGDFQRKWQANRVAAAELERTGYEFLESGTGNPRSYFKIIGQIQHRRHFAIVGISEDEKAAGENTQSRETGQK